MDYLPDELYPVSEIRRAEQWAINDADISEDELMARAGLSAFELIQVMYPDSEDITIVCGPGNNGGDGYVLAHLAEEAGLAVQIYYLGDPEQLSAAAFAAYTACAENGIAMQPFASGTELDADVVVDAIFGIGLERDVSGLFAQAFRAINNADANVVALDIPSGLQADSGAILAEAVEADITITFIALKQGLFTGAGKRCCGDIILAELGLEEFTQDELTPVAYRVNLAEVQEAFLPRAADCHKGDFGHVLVVGGDFGMAGAVRMAGEAAYRVGAGLVTVATRPGHCDIVSAMRPELMCHGIQDAKELQPLLERATVVVIGPGLGREQWGKELFTAVVKTDLPLIVDADGLYHLSQQNLQRHNWVLTPHPGEAARLLELNNDTVQRDRYMAVKTLQKNHLGVSVLKGAGTLIAGTLPEVAVCGAGNPGMATGGMGDILSGVIAGLVAQGYALEFAALAGVCVHAEAGDLAALGGERGMMATDLLPYLQLLVNPKDDDEAMSQDVLDELLV
ncbi:MAG: bifunctional ADP-dependent NAD(P)H-hydrate dehydratase/NAD(P)H-hydrate epimerase [Legionellales bacterium]|nr:bifunctional ADP-dependent NAD(P)H-hydrate dehydratase/NAD(P)H-hydrate epimerase [Legionellales bacterium]|tara:strand:+ start:16875 stop:18404 length:1530 start_codon:yes stop_codon:yes gene_type:complete